MSVKHLFFALLRAHVLGGEGLSDEDRAAVGEKAEKLFQLASAHDMAHLIGFSLYEAGLAEAYAHFENHHLLALFRYESIAYEQIRVGEVLEAASIPHMPLKGALLRELYPEAWMRPSCDVDVLVKGEDLDRAVAALVENGFTIRDRTSHDVGFASAGHIPTELHFRLWENGQSDKIRDLLESAWDTATLVDGTSYQYAMTDELFYFYHVAHMAKHVEHGGCGIRPFLDMWLMDKAADAEARRREMLEKGGLLQFAEAARALCRVWFEGAPHSEITRGFEAFVLEGGVYGTETNRVAIQQQQRGGRLRYALSRIFVTREVLKVAFPILDRHPWLFPFLQVARWWNILRRGDGKRSLDELAFSGSLSDDRASEMRHLLDTLGLPREGERTIEN